MRSCSSPATCSKIPAALGALFVLLMYILAVICQKLAVVSFSSTSSRGTVSFFGTHGGIGVDNYAKCWKLECVQRGGEEGGMHALPAMALKTMEAAATAAVPAVVQWDDCSSSNVWAPQEPSLVSSLLLFPSSSTGHRATPAVANTPWKQECHYAFAPLSPTTPPYACPAHAIA